MTPLEPLAPDQRAVVSLVLQQGRSPTTRSPRCWASRSTAVQARAHAGLAALAPANGLPAEITGPLADYLLGQQAARDADATRGLLAESAPARGWAAGVAARSRTSPPGRLPAIPGATRRGRRAEPAAAAAGAGAGARRPAPARRRPRRPRPPTPRPPPAEPPGGRRRRAPRASRLGGVLLIARRAGASWASSSSSCWAATTTSPAAERATAAATATATPTAAARRPQVADEIALRAAGGGDAEGADDRLPAGRRARSSRCRPQNLPDGAAKPYAVWLQEGGKRRAGSASPTRRRTARSPCRGPSADLADGVPAALRDLRHRRRLAGDHGVGRRSRRASCSAASCPAAAARPRSSFPGFMIPAGSQCALTARSSCEVGLPSPTHGAWSRPTAWWWVIVAPAAAIASLAARFAARHWPAGSSRSCAASTVK